MSVSAAAATAPTASLVLATGILAIVCLAAHRTLVHAS